MTTTMDTPDLLESIQAKLEAPRPDCLLWPAAADRGYGRIWVDGTAKRVHRVVWELTHGPIPDGMTVDHLCRIRSCCNVEHLELVTQAENVKRAQPHRARVMQMSALSSVALSRPRDDEDQPRAG